MKRRSLLTGLGAAVAAGLGGGLATDWNERGQRASVFIAKASDYEANLEARIEAGLRELGFDHRFAKGKSVLLKPNLVEPSRATPEVNTHPHVVRAVAGVFRRLGARHVFVAEGPGHCRDSLVVLEQSGLGETLDECGLEFVDLNHDEIDFVPNRLKLSGLPRLALPRALRDRKSVV